MKSLLLLQLANYAFILVLQLRQELRQLPQRFWLLSLAMESTKPLLITVKGLASALYLQDFLIPLVLLFCLKDTKVTDSGIKSLVLSLAALLVFIPCLMTMLLALLDPASEQFQRRNFLTMLLGLYRNLLLVAVFYLAIGMRLTQQQISAVLALFLLANIPLAIYALLHYLGIQTISIFKVLDFSNSPDPMQKVVLGTGFMGLFRGAVGQWYANLACICLILMSISKANIRLLALAMLALSAAIVFVSFSRAGVIAMLCGFAILLPALGIKRFSLYLPIVFAIVLIPLIYGASEILARLETISSASDHSSLHRFAIWFHALDVIAGDIKLLLIGSGWENTLYMKRVLGASSLHNDYLSSIFKMGFIGLIAYLVVLAKLFQRFNAKRLSSNSREAKLLAWLGIALLVSNSLLGFTQDHLFRTYSGYVGGVMMFFIYGLLAGQTESNAVLDKGEGKQRAAIKLNYV